MFARIGSLIAANRNKRMDLLRERMINLFKQEPMN